ncbi:uncharacterized protein LOC130975533 [Arachis stenosperma]|uniref:uncharacterized protein LOC130975533 n=1 Tax=Arachis stenosperma TaxID=217475 RepID=UPI0025ABA30F|nr:uncharacterized protein LOC130975533 [Arachis stenosperma]
MRVTHYDRRASVFSVEKTDPLEGWSQNLYRVRLNMQQCDRGVFQALYYLCRHALAAWSTASIEWDEWGTFVDPVYRIASDFKVYEMEFSPIPDKKMWASWYGARLKPNLSMHRKTKGQPKLTQLRNEMDKVERFEKRCSLCR